MKGIILVGGLGTRLKPLTLTKPKPLVPFANKAIIKHQLEALARAGVAEIILAVGHMQEQLQAAFAGYDRELGITLRYSVEETPMGTAGPLSFLRETLQQETAPFFVLNSDVICSFPFKEMLAHHQAHGGSGTILATRVADPTRYGVMVTDADDRIQQFVEKPEVFVGDRINAGIYLFDQTILRYIEDRPMSIEKEVLPRMIQETLVKTFDLSGFWMDIGQPKDYLLGHALFLQAQHPGHPGPLSLIDPTARVSPQAVIGNMTVIGPNVVVEAGAEIRNAVVLDGAVIEQRAVVTDSIIGWGARVAQDARVEEHSLLGAAVQVEQGITVTKGVVLPHTVVSLPLSISPSLAAQRETSPLSSP